jgi:hypothetical protein
MVEVLKHMLGCCGEGHPSLIFLIGATPLIAMWSYIKQGFLVVILSVKSYLKQLYK